MKTMTAKYPGHCLACRQPIERGQRINFFGHGRAEHVLCGTGEPVQGRQIAGACWICGNAAGYFRSLGAATPVWCDACNQVQRAKDAARTVGNVRFNTPDRFDMQVEDNMREACGL